MITAIILFIISIILFCLDFYFVQYAWMTFNDTAFNIAEVCLIVFNVAIVVCGVILIKKAANKVKNNLGSKRKADLNCSHKKRKGVFFIVIIASFLLK